MSRIIIEEVIGVTEAANGTEMDVEGQRQTRDVLEGSSGRNIPEKSKNDAWGRVSRQKRMRSRPGTGSYGSPEVGGSFIFIEHSESPEGSTRTPEAEDKGAGIQQAKIQSRETKALAEAGLTGILQKVADRDVDMVLRRERKATSSAVTLCRRICSSRPNIFWGRTTQPQRQQSSGGLFAAAQPSTTQPATTSIFGQPTTSQQAPSLFGGGNTNTDGTPNAGGGLFGSGTNTNTQLPGHQYGAIWRWPAAGPTGGGRALRKHAAEPVCSLPGAAFSATRNNLPRVAPAFSDPTAPPTRVVGDCLVPPDQRVASPVDPCSCPSPPTPQHQRARAATDAAAGVQHLRAARRRCPKSAAAAAAATAQNAFGASTLSTSALCPPVAAQSGQGQGQDQAADAQTQFARLTARIEGIAAA
ncbi:hypothetical protein B0H14DRAFT_3151901 [Mycena olivaceomarginata]|nr:hypothetical protein B0H14DRAFT_3151901 [Mycena olivaceomarginata]